MKKMMKICILRMRTPMLVMLSEVIEQTNISKHIVEEFILIPAPNIVMAPPK